MTLFIPRSTLLSTLISLRYEKTINTMADVAESGLPVLLGKSSGTYSSLKNDPREDGQRIFSNHKGAFLPLYFKTPLTSKIVLFCV
jgi:hypothetical protein